MGNKVDISEVIEFSTDFSTASEDLKSQLKQIEKDIEQLQSMDGFSGEAASGAKKYFGELHVTVLKSFEHLLTDLDERIKRHLNAFKLDVDQSESAIIYSGYLSEKEKEITDTYELFSAEQETIRETLANVSDISSASQPKGLLWDSSYKKSVETILDLEESLQSYTSKEIANASEIEQLQQQIETTIKESGEVTEDNQFQYFMGSITPDSLLDLQGYNQGKHREMIDDARESKDSAITNMDGDSQQIASKAFEDLSNGTIEEDEYYAYLDELRKLNNGDADGEVSGDFIRYVVDNLDGVSKDFKSNSLTEVINKQFIDNGYDKLKRADLIKDMNAGKPGSGSFLREQGNKVLKIGKAVSGSLTALTVGYGTYDDYVNTDKTLGEAGTKNIADGIVSMASTAGAASIATTVAVSLGSATPIGWAVIAGIGAATIATTAFNFAYDNNFLGLQDGLDWVGKKLDEAGEAVSGFFNAINPFSTN